MHCRCRDCNAFFRHGPSANEGWIHYRAAPSASGKMGLRKQAAETSQLLVNSGKSELEPLMSVSE